MERAFKEQSSLVRITGLAMVTALNKLVECLCMHKLLDKVDVGKWVQFLLPPEVANKIKHVEAGALFGLRRCEESGVIVEAGEQEVVEKLFDGELGVSPVLLLGEGLADGGALLAEGLETALLAVDGLSEFGDKVVAVGFGEIGEFVL